MTIVRRNLLPIWAIAVNSYREAIRSKVLNSLLGLSIIIVSSSFLLGEMSLHQEVRITTNLSLFMTTLFGVVTGIYSSITLLHTELDRRTIYTLLSKPIDRIHLLLGKLLGVTFVCLTVVGTLGLVGHLVVVWQGGAWHPSYGMALVTAFYQSIMTATISILFASFSGSLIAGILSFSVFIAGNLQTQLDLAKGHFSETFPPIVLLLEMTEFLLPNMEALNLSQEALYQKHVDTTYLLGASWYTFSYMTIVMTITFAVFRRVELK